MAFHSILEHVETLGLSEGEYLSTTNALKKAFQETNTGKYTITHVPINLSFDYIDGNGNSRATVNITKITRMQYVKREDEQNTYKPTKFIFTFNLLTNGKTETMSLAKEDQVFFGFLMHLSRIHKPTCFTTRYANGHEEILTYKEHIRQVKDINAVYVLDECDDDDPLCYERFAYRSIDIFDDTVMWEFRRYMVAREE